MLFLMLRIEHQLFPMLQGAEGGVQTLDLDPLALNTDPSSEGDEVTSKERGEREVKDQEDWNLVHKPRKEAKDPTVQKLKVAKLCYCNKIDFRQQQLS